MLNEVATSHYNFLGYSYYTLACSSSLVPVLQYHKWVVLSDVAWLFRFEPRSMNTFEL
jgi:hypothetical protein